MRLASGLSGERLAVRTGMSQTKVSRIETGRTLATVFDVQAIVRALEVPEADAEELLKLARAANTEFHDVRSSRRRGLEHRQRELAKLEQDSREIRFFLPTMLTGLLHTPEYAHASMPYPQAAAIAKRLERQTVLYNREKRFTFLMTEGAVRWPILGPEGMAVQVDRLVSLASLASVRMGLIPSNGVSGLPALLSIFVVYDERLATAETYGGLVVMRDPRDVEIHLERFRLFEEHALWGTDATSLLASISADFRARA
ncbi:helix-turn-helix domain-containing protein [Catenulispora sp. NL8]|uniref:Helix-turn-helix domain-containing protein n=1 Tax=Catenulispora pinistramenti TaxID=2705254 RepID=A0ABS5KKD1_9ACTN|nr:helix-turn-helix domain-containing protein [Catenulispora pinistramenti]